MFADSTIHILAASITTTIGLLAYIGLSYAFDASVDNNVAGKSKTNSTRFYECSTYSKSQNKFRTSLPHIVFLVMFLVYDIDLLLVTSEVLVIFGFGLFEVFILLLFLFFLILGLLFDSRKVGFSWYLF